MSAVHNHSPYRPVCNERIIGACMVTIDPADIPHLGDFADDPREALHIIADNVRDIAQGDLDATEQIVRWLADLLPKPPKPAEPTGLGAVVEAADGTRWIRYSPAEWWFDADIPATGLRYADLAAVKVLSVGVQP